MAPQSGTALAVADDTFDLGDLGEVTTTVTVRRDGKPVQLTAYKQGDGCPLSVVVSVAISWRQYRDAGADDVAFLEHRGRLLEIAIPDLTREEREALAGSDRASGVLRHLGWFSPIADPEDDAAPEADGGEGSITDVSSPDSPQPITA